MVSNFGAFPVDFRTGRFVRDLVLDRPSDDENEGDLTRDSEGDLTGDSKGELKGDHWKDGEDNADEAMEKSGDVAGGSD